MRAFDWKPVECADERGYVGEFGMVEDQAGCGILDKLHWYDGTSWLPAIHCHEK
jgi:hypothetical protein